MNPYDPPVTPTVEAPATAQAFQPVQEPPHSGVGVASFVISLIVGIGEFALILVAGVLEASTPGGIDEESAAAIALGLLMFGGIFLCFLGVALGIAGALQPNRKRLFAFLGLALNGVILLGIGGLMVLGLMIQAAEM